MKSIQKNYIENNQKPRRVNQETQTYDPNCYFIGISLPDSQNSPVQISHNYDMTLILVI